MIEYIQEGETMFKDKISISAFLLTLLSVPLGHLFTLDFQASIVWPTLGVIFSFVVMYKHKVYVPIFSALFIGYVFSNIVIMRYAILSALSLSFMLTLSTFVAVIAGQHLINWFNIQSIFKRINIMLFPLIIVVITTITAFFGVLSLLINNQIILDNFMFVFLVWMLGDVFSLLIFGGPILFALNYDSCLINAIKTNKAKHELVFYIILFSLSLMLFDERFPFINYENHKFLFFPFAIYAAYNFQHRAYYIGTLMFLSAMVIYPPYQVGEISYFYLMFDINLFLLFVAILFFSLKLLFIRLEKQQNNVKRVKKRREGLVASMETLFNLSSDMISEDSLETQQQAIKTFRIIYNLFNSIDYGACMIIEDGKIKWIDAIGFDKDILNKLKQDAYEFKGRLEQPLLVKDAERWIKRDFGEAYEVYKKYNPPIKESVLMSIKISDQFTCEMSFDIAQGSESTYTNNLMEYFNSLNILLNGFYESQLVSFHSDEKKTSMVNSLLKIIELFDTHTYIHSQDVAYLVKEIAAAFQYNHETINRLYWAGIVHDIGKIGVPKNIVNKQGTLTISEYETMQDHVHFGYAILNKSEHLKMIASYVKHHHERFDGKGYPDGIEGTNLPFENYILNIAEVVGTLARDRSYAKNFTQQEILSLLSEERGLAWPSRLVDKVIKMIHNGLLSEFY